MWKNLPFVFDWMWRQMSTWLPHWLHADRWLASIDITKWIIADAASDLFPDDWRRRSACDGLWLRTVRFEMFGEFRPIATLGWIPFCRAQRIALLEWKLFANWRSTTRLKCSHERQHRSRFRLSSNFEWSNWLSHCCFSSYSDFVSIRSAKSPQKK